MIVPKDGVAQCIRRDNDLRNGLVHVFEIVRFAVDTRAHLPVDDQMPLCGVPTEAPERHAAERGLLVVVRQILVKDAFTALPSLPLQDVIVTSLPDAMEVGLAITGDYQRWVHEAVLLCASRVRDDGLLVFYQTDRKVDGQWLSKPAVIIPAAGRMLWHKIVLRRDVGKRDLYRPGYAHLLAFSRAGRIGAASPDVLHAGKSLWKHGMGFAAATFVAEYGRGFGGGQSFCDPFCGHGTSLIAAVRAGFGTVTGIDRDPECCERARMLTAPDSAWLR